MLFDATAANATSACLQPDVHTHAHASPKIRVITSGTLPQTPDFEKFLCDGSIVEMCYPLSSRKTDAQSMINYAVIGQLSWQYLWAPTLDHSSLPQWSSSPVYSMIPSGGFISNSWHLSLCSMHSQLSVSPLNAIQLCLFQMCPTCIIPSTS